MGTQSESGGRARGLADRLSEDYASDLREAFRRWNQGDYEGTTALMHPDVEWRTAGLFPDLASTYHGRDGVRKFFRDFTSPWDEIVMEPQIEADGDVAVVDMHLRARGRGGIEVDITIFLRFVRRDGLTCFVSVHPTREQAAGAS